MIVAGDSYAASLMQDVGVSLGKVGYLGNQSNTGASAPASRGGQHAHAVSPRKSVHPSSTTLDGSRGEGWPWTNRPSSTRRGVARVVRGCVAVPPATHLALVYAAEIGVVL
jgi:hypothetical protein